MIKFICEKCDNVFESNRRTHKGRKIRFCSHKCAMQADWNTIDKRGNKNIAKRPEVREKMRKSGKGKHSGKLAYNWKGDKASYTSIHMWVKAHYGKPMQCEHCGIKPPKHRIEWANKSGKYLREDRNDWIQLCTPCHRKFDFNKLSKSRQREVIKQKKETMKKAQSQRWL